MYTVNYHDNQYPLSSEINQCKCDSCGKVKKTQNLPAEHNAGEIFTANICFICIIKLAIEMIFNNQPRTTYKDSYQ